MKFRPRDGLKSFVEYFCSIRFADFTSAIVSLINAENLTYLDFNLNLIDTFPESFKSIFESLSPNEKRRILFYLNELANINAQLMPAIQNLKLLKEDTEYLDCLDRLLHGKSLAAIHSSKNEASTTHPNGGIIYYDFLGYHGYNIASDRVLSSQIIRRVGLLNSEVSLQFQTKNPLSLANHLIIDKRIAKVRDYLNFNIAETDIDGFNTTLNSLKLFTLTHPTMSYRNILKLINILKGAREMLLHSKLKASCSQLSLQDSNDPPKNAFKNRLQLSLFKQQMISIITSDLMVKALRNDANLVLELLADSLSQRINQRSANRGEVLADLESWKNTFLHF